MQALSQAVFIFPYMALLAGAARDKLEEMHMHLQSDVKVVVEKNKLGADFGMTASGKACVVKVTDATASLAKEGVGAGAVLTKVDAEDCDWFDFDDKFDKLVALGSEFTVTVDGTAPCSDDVAGGEVVTAEDGAGKYGLKVQRGQDGVVCIVAVTDGSQAKDEEFEAGSVLVKIGETRVTWTTFASFWRAGSKFDIVAVGPGMCKGEGDSIDL